MLTIASEIISAAWFFMLGTCIGSFLNVVIYRVPAGKSLNGPSRCPNCDSTIKWYDNIPVLGWLMLGGRCRNCEIDISARYPRVEFLLGSVFFSLAICDVAFGLINWPGVKAPYHRGFTWNLFDPQPEYLFVFAAHAVLMAVLLAATLIEFDGNRIPFGLILFAMIGLLIVACCSPALPDGTERKIGNLFALIRDPSNIDFASLRIRSAGLLYGLVVGGIIAWAYSSPNSPHHSLSRAGRFEIATLCGLIGGWLGIFAMTCVVTMAAVLCRFTEFVIGDSQETTPPTESQPDDEEAHQVSPFWPRLPLGQIFAATWFYFLTAGLMAKMEVFPMGWDRRLWIGVFTAIAVAVFFRHRTKIDMDAQSA